MREPFHTRSPESDPVFHWQADCPAGREVIDDGNVVDGVRDMQRRPCEVCLRIERRDVAMEACPSER